MTMWWPVRNVSRDTTSCQTTVKLASNRHKRKSTLKRQHEEVETPWSKIGVNPFKIKGRMYSLVSITQTL